MTRLNFQVPFFYGRVTSSELADMVSLFRQCLSRTKDSFCGRGTSRSFGCNPAPLSADYCPQTKVSFPNFLWRKGIILALKGLSNHLAFFSSPTISSGHAIRVTCIPFFVQPIIGHGVRVAFDLHFDLDLLLCSTGCEELTFVHVSLLAVSLWGLLVQTQKGGELISLFLSRWHTTSQLFL